MDKIINSLSCFSVESKLTVCVYLLWPRSDNTLAISWSFYIISHSCDFFWVFQVTVWLHSQIIIDVFQICTFKYGP